MLTPWVLWVYYSPFISQISYLIVYPPNGLKDVKILKNKLFQKIDLTPEELTPNGVNWLVFFFLLFFLSLFLIYLNSNWPGTGRLGLPSAFTFIFGGQIKDTEIQGVYDPTFRIAALHAWIQGDLGWQLRGILTPIKWSTGLIKAKSFCRKICWDQIFMAQPSEVTSVSGIQSSYAGGASPAGSELQRHGEKTSWSEKNEKKNPLCFRQVLTGAALDWCIFPVSHQPKIYTKKISGHPLSCIDLWWGKKTGRPQNTPVWGHTQNSHLWALTRLDKSVVITYVFNPNTSCPGFYQMIFLRKSQFVCMNLTWHWSTNSENFWRVPSAGAFQGPKLVASNSCQVTLGDSSKATGNQFFNQIAFWPESISWERFGSEPPSKLTSEADNPENCSGSAVMPM